METIKEGWKRRERELHRAARKVEYFVGDTRRGKYEDIVCVELSVCDSFKIILFSKSKFCLDCLHFPVAIFVDLLSTE